MGKFRSLKLTLKDWNKRVFGDLDTMIEIFMDVGSNMDLLARNNSIYTGELYIISKSI